MQNEPPSRPKRRPPALFHFAAGLASGITTAALLQPADLLKTRLQQPGPAPPLTHLIRSVLAAPSPLRLLWRGVVPSILRTGVGSALYFGLLHQLRAAAPSPASNTAHLATGALARVAAGLVVNPFTVLKVRFESSAYPPYPSLAAAARHTLARDGYRAFFAGAAVTAARDAPYAALYVLGYERAKDALGRFAGAGTAGTDASPAGGLAAAAVHFAAGVGAAVVATTLTNPFDAVKTRVQLAPTARGGGAGGVHVLRAARAARAMVRDEGWRSLFAGLSLRLGRKAVSSALAWTVYEEMVRRAERVVV